VAIVALTLVGILGLVIVAVGLGGMAGTTPTQAPTSTATASPAASTSPMAPTPAPTPAPSHPSATSAATAQPSPDPLVLGLLGQDDLPGLSSPLGVQEGTDYDIDEGAFEANGGIRVVSREWQSLADTGLAAVFDFRMQFPSEAAATAYLDAAEAILSEADATGQTPVASPPVIGSDARVYGLETSGADGPVLLRTYLFRVGHVVAKVEAGGTGVDAATTDALASTAARRIAAAGPPVSGTPRPAASPTSVPPPSAPLPTGEALAALLLEHVPPAIGPSCVPDPQRLWEGELATLVCTDAGSDVTVTYSGFGSAAAAEAAFDASIAAIDLSDLADSCDTGTWAGSYEVEDEEVGRAACWAEQGGQAVMWSDDRLAIVAVAVSPSLDPAGLYLWWLDAGPVP
jgi:hypothetical protein